ncbi:MAG: tetratricopeptide repeat protein [Victivallales bacterium]|nr:tetratricopeptide repeat protein [Victivallales bacterium]
MERKELNEISSGLRNTFQRAGEACKKNNLEYARELYKSIVKKEPGFQAARDALRDVERKLTGQLGSFAKWSSTIKNRFHAPKIRRTIKKDPLKAMGLAEEMVGQNLSDPLALNLLAEAAQAADADQIAIEAYQILREYQPKNETNLRNLVELYRKNGENIKALHVFQQIAQLHPKNLEIEQELREAAAMASMEKGRWNESGDFTTKLKDGEESLSLEKEDRIARSEDDVADMIEQYHKEIADGNDTIDNYRKLAEYLHRAERFDEAEAAYNKITEKMGKLDPMIDVRIERVVMDRFDRQIAAGKAAGRDTSELEKEKYRYRLTRAVERVNNFPNDSVLRYQLGLVYWDGNMVDDALEQLQMGQRAPKYRLNAMVYIGRCFHRKKQYDLAVEQFEKAISEMPVMDNAKKDAVYHLGLVYSDMGNKEKAGDCFKDIYQADINFMDIKDRIKAIYG